MSRIMERLAPRIWSGVRSGAVSSGHRLPAVGEGVGKGQTYTSHSVSNEPLQNTSILQLNLLQAGLDIECLIG